MATRVVEGKKPYTGGKAIEIDENKVISLRLRDENNLIIYDEGDDEIYVDLQLDDEITPTSVFPVGVTTGRAIVDNGWDIAGTILVCKTTSGDNIKLLYGDNGKLYIDNGTGAFKQIYFKADVDLIVDSLQAQIDVLSGLGKFLSLWDCATGEPISFPLDIPYEYSTGDWYMINNIDTTTNYRPAGSEYDEDDPDTKEVETESVNIGDVYIYDGSVWLLQKNAGTGGGNVTFAQILGQPTDNTNLATALGDKQDTLVSGTNIKTINSNSILGNGDLSLNEVPSGGTNGQVLTQTNNGPAWQNATGGDVLVSTQANNIFTPGMKIWGGTQSDYQSLTPDSNTAYLLMADQPSPGWQPGANTIGYWKLNGDLTDEMGNYNGTGTGGATITYEALPGDSNIQCAKVYSDGWSDGISLPNTICSQILSAHTSFSFGGFVKTTAGWAELVYMEMLLAGGGICCSIRDGKFYFWTDGQGEIYYPSNAVISANTWYSVVFTYNHTTRTKSFYANGTLIGASTESSDYSTSSTPNVAFLARINSNSLLSNVFLETNKARDEQEAKLFHDTFKSLYGIS